MERALVFELVEQKHKGDRCNNGWKDQTWTACVSKVAIAIPEASRQLANKERMKTKMENLKKLWKAWVIITNLSGWPIDDQGLPVNTPEVMEVYFAAHKEARYFKTKPLPYQKQLYEIVEGRTATGRRAGGIQRVGELAKAGETHSQSPDDSNRSATTDSEPLRRRTSSIQLTGMKRRRMNACEISDLTNELRRYNDIMERELEESNPIGSAITMFNCTLAADFDLDEK